MSPPHSPFLSQWDGGRIPHNQESASSAKPVDHLEPNSAGPGTPCLMVGCTQAGHQFFTLRLFFIFLLGLIEKMVVLRPQRNLFSLWPKPRCQMNQSSKYDYRLRSAPPHVVNCTPSKRKGVRGLEGGAFLVLAVLLAWGLCLTAPSLPFPRSARQDHSLLLLQKVNIYCVLCARCLTHVFSLILIIL